MTYRTGQSDHQGVNLPERERTPRQHATPGEGSVQADDGKMVPLFALTEAVVDALEYVVEVGRIACREDAAILRSLLAAVRPGWNTNHDAAPAARASKPEASAADSALPDAGTGRITRAAYEGDIVSRLRNWRGLHLAHGGRLFEEAADEIERLREAIRRLANQDATLSVQGGNVIVEMDATLTDAEREAVMWAIVAADLEKTETAGWFFAFVGERAATLRGLLARTQDDGNRQ